MLRLRRRGAAFAAFAATVATALAGCGDNIKGDRADLVHGKQLFVERCGACHTLARAGTRGAVGPDLDAAFRQSLQDGFKRDTVEGVVKEQILFPTTAGRMPAKVVTGQNAVDVAAYVGASAAKPGEDEGALATAVRATEQREVAAEGGRLEIPADPNGQLAYLVSRASATPGALEIDSRNDASIAHDIALQEGTDGADLGKGETVSNGGVSRLSVNVRPGRYTFYCTLPGHREGGMEGTLSVR
ncbi:MAG TPA: c-type cytochrome [Conexibacter sp.]|nr:c-type cytochrome [Conexibacter sp.]